MGRCGNKRDGAESESVESGAWKMGPGQGGKVFVREKPEGEAQGMGSDGILSGFPRATGFAS